jgi:hypothetical protein
LSKAKPSRLDDNIFAEKGEDLSGQVSQAPARSVAAAVVQPEPAPTTPAPVQNRVESNEEDEEAPPRKKRKVPTDTVATTIAIPPVIMARIQERLRDDQEHNLRTLVFLGLSKLGIEIEPEFLAPKRRRWTR